GANHSTPSDEESPSNRAAHDIIRETTTAFWNAYLRGDAGALFSGRANVLHVQTGEPLLRSFLLFHEGEPFDEARLRETERNLRALDFLRSASVTASEPHEGVVDVSVVTEDAFTTDFNADFSNDGGRSLYDVDLTQKNLFGSGAEADLRVANGRERRTRSLELLHPALFGAYWNGDAFFADSSDGNEEKLAVERPLFSYATPFTVSGSFDHLLRNARVYENGEVASLFRQEHREAALAYGRVLASTPRSSLRLVGGVDLLADGFTPLAGVAPLDRRFHFVEAGADWQAFDFLKLDHVDLGLREQDFNLGVHGSVYIARSTDGALRFRSDDSAGHAFGPHAFVLTRLSATTRAGNTNRNTIVSSDTRVVDRLDTRFPSTLVFRGRIDLGSDLDRDVQFFADGQNGLRAYPNFAFSGARRAVVNGEYRVFLGREWLQLVEPGAALFVDSGNTAFRNFKTDAGAGLRFGISRFESAMIRIDLAWAFNNSPLSRRGFVVSVATTQAF
ncbi:MAG TPA: hypothetical protein VG323_08140, partial [Thermoanaerobaculia bacterium]|nr:hypothetical protein [Thermoanaerobaculia bacterium]